LLDDLTRGCINLHAILRNLEDLCDLDPDARGIIMNKNLSILFAAKSIPPALLVFAKGKCKMTRGTGHHDIKLFFKSPQHFNRMIDGLASPIPLKGFTKISFLTGEFSKLAERLAYFLKPTPQLLEDERYSEINTILTAYTAFYALAEIGNNDPIGKLNAARIADGTVGIRVLNGGPEISLIAKGGKLEIKKGIEPEARAFMTFDSLDTASGILNGGLDSYACIGNGSLEIKGYIPMVDNMNKLLAQVAAYLK
jgi:hypothetical protein